MSNIDISVILLHDQMVDKQQKLITASLTMIDVPDIARSCRTYGARNLFISHPAPTIRKLARALKQHWEEGYGATYNPNRKEALEYVEIVSDLDEAIQKIDQRTGRLPKLVATSARDGGKRITFSEFQTSLVQSNDSYLLMLGTGWGMSEALLNRADFFLEPIKGPTPYNHLSVRSACAIMLDRLLGL
jgi:hypothetical protein